MVGFFVGLVAGGVVGVVCDRLWRKVENRVRLRIHGGYHHGLDGDGIYFEVKNQGNERLPPIRLCLFSPSLGSCYIFPPVALESKLSELWPGQEREFICLVDCDPHDPTWNMIAKEAGNPRIAFRIQPVDGDKVIFQSHPIGKALARILAKKAGGAAIGNASGELWGGLSYERIGPITWIRRKLYVRSLLKRVAADQSTTAS